MRQTDDGAANKLTSLPLVTARGGGNKRSKMAPDATQSTPAGVEPTDIDINANDDSPDSIRTATV